MNEGVNMSIIGVDIGSSTTKIIEYKDNKIINKKIYQKNDIVQNNIQDFIQNNNITNIDRFVLTGIGADKVDLSKYDVPVKNVEEFVAIATGGKYISGKDEAIVVSVGTGTALIKVTPEEIKHLGGTGVGAGTLLNMCDRMLGVKSFNEILELSKQGDLSKIDLRIGDVTNQEIETLPKDLTLANFGKFESDSKKEDIVLGLLNMIFEVIGMMAVFATLNSKIREIVVIGNITVIPVVKDIIEKLEKLHKVNFILSDEAEFAVVLGGIKRTLEETNY